jgi:inward rectifier potassium channel
MSFLQKLWRKRVAPPDQISVVGVSSRPLRDIYHLILRVPWSVALAGLAVVYLAFNVCFATAYDVFGGVGGLSSDSFRDYFFFSVQTMATIGYGTMYPVTTTAHVLVTCEAIVGMTIVALTTGLIFAKFSAVRARIQFAENLVIGPLDGIPTIMIRMGNERSSQIIDGVVRVVVYRTEVSVEGVKMYRMYDLPLERERAPALSRSWTVLHRVRPGTLLHGYTPEQFVKDEIEFLVALTGLDELTGQTMHARFTYDGAKTVWGARHADLLADRPDGGLVLDMTRFQHIVPTKPIDGFPYPRAAAAPEAKESP